MKLCSDSIFDRIHAVAQVTTPQSGHAVLNFVAIRIVNVNVLSPANNSATVLCIVIEVCKWVKMMVLIEFLKRGGVESSVHGISPKFGRRSLTVGGRCRQSKS